MCRCSYNVIAHIQTQEKKVIVLDDHELMAQVS